jgi:hypothetical protein
VEEGEERVTSYNQSLIKAAACPLRFKLLRDSGNVKRGSQEGVTNIGSAFHSFAKLYYEHCWGRGIQTDVDALDQLVEETLIGGALSDEEAEEFRVIAEQFVDSDIVSEREKTQLELTIGTPDGQFFGTLDKLVDHGDHAEIRDYKTWRRIRSLTECKTEIQLPFYAGLVASNFEKYRTFALTYSHVRFGVDVSFTIDWADALAMIEKMRKRVEQLEKLAVFDPRAGSHCDWCEFAQECPLVEAGQVKVITSSEQAEEMAARLYATETAIKAMKSRLKAWIDKAAPVAVGDMVLNYNESRRVVFDSSEIVANLRGEGLSLAKILQAFSTNQTELKRLAKLEKWGKEKTKELVGLGRPKLSTRFGFARTKEEK